MESSNPPANMRNLSKMVAQIWEQESPEVKQYWDQVEEQLYKGTYKQMSKWSKWSKIESLVRKAVNQVK
ncbi:hypothetical protein C1646_765500 [Rhizophagus diaphanus]|nr:hypothetical protein C1646_765500 [Rhizophagus diaphanus] [Rhizophagus sp. MUCL 43196]